MQPPAAPPSHINYPVIAATEKHSYAGMVDSDLLTGTAYVQVQNADTGTRCYGQGHLVAPAAGPSCKGGKGTCSLTCDDGRRIACEYELASCTTGVGVGQDQNNNWIAFVFGPKIDATNARSVADKLRQFVSRLSSRQKRRTASGFSFGTGFFVSPRGYLVTADHVVAEKKTIAVVLHSGNVLRAAVVGADPANDLALLKVKTKDRPVPVIAATGVIAGQEVFTLGYPLLQIEGQQQKATFGHVNAISGMHDDVRFLQTDTPVQPGNSGGPLLDQKGRVIGVVTETLDPIETLKLVGAVPQNVNYAVKSDYLLPLLARYGVKPERQSGNAKTVEDAIRRLRDSVVLVVAR